MDFLEKARTLKPRLFEKKYFPLSETEPIGRYMRSGDHFTLDFGTHLVGSFHLSVAADQTPDSPLVVELLFAEMPFELDDYTYTGGLSSTWIQKETICLDYFSGEIVLPRRYAFRYVKITFPGNTAYRVRYEQAYCVAVTSADETRLEPLPEGTDPLLVHIDTIALRTLRNCMQSVFEDGPKRDRRLWLGDLYLQAKTNFYTYRNYDLVKRCLYLFAGLPYPNGGLSSAVYHEPMLKNQAWVLHDYALFFIGVLYDCYEYAHDLPLLQELWPTAYRQAEIAAEAADEQGLVQPKYYFIDWCDALDKTAAAQGTAVAMLKKALRLAEIIGDEGRAAALRGYIRRLSEAARGLYDEKRRLFVSGPSQQVSWASQIWMILAGILTRDENAEVIDNLQNCREAIRTVTPYTMHFYIEALIACGKMEEAMRTVCAYWGGMAEMGADCFWEVYIPEEPEASPYQSHRINSYCHAWSCTPAYFIRKYFIGCGTEAVCGKYREG